VLVRSAFIRSLHPEWRDPLGLQGCGRWNDPSGGSSARMACIGDLGRGLGIRAGAGDDVGAELTHAY
jgi:hypothetical protein